VNEYTDMATVLPEGKKGEAEIRHFVIDAHLAAFSRLRAVVTRGREGAAKAGTFAQLFVGGSLVMSDTEHERQSNWDLLRESHYGDILIAGLGLGMVLLPILARGNVKSVTVIEKSRDAIDLVEPHIREAAGADADKLTVIHADIFEWKPPRGARYHTIYFDIWGDINTDHLKEMRQLHQKFRRRKVKGGWMSSWLYDELRQGWY